MLVLEQLIKQRGTVSLNDMEEILIDSDRVTIYRTLSLFVRHGIVHSLDVVNRGRIYALCDDSCSPGGHDDRHPHFLCVSCGNMICSEDFSYTIETSAGSERYSVQSVEVVIRGICPSCNK